ncbi:transposase [Runella limosa]|uniref:transposase n=1 Tax=Runella limosa TaxID=370978 RepID=UPI00146FC65C|nr:transposase [Runella limosa]
MIKHLLIKVRKGAPLQYITLFVDMNTTQIIDIEEGRGSEAVKQFVQKLSNPQEVKQISINMSPAFIKAVKDYLINADITFDKFHMIKHLNDTID